MSKKLEIRKMEKGDARAVIDISNDYPNAFGWSMVEVQGLLDREETVGYLAFAREPSRRAIRFPAGFVMGYPSEDFDTLWKGYAAQRLPEDLVEDNYFYLHGLVVSPELPAAGLSKKRVANSLLKQFERELHGAGYRGIVSVAPIEITTGYKPGRFGFSKDDKIEGFWNYMSLGRRLTIPATPIYKSIHPAD